MQSLVKSACHVVAAVAIWLCVSPALSAPKVTRPACAVTGEFPVVDFSTPVTNLRATGGKSGLDALKDFGVTTVFRYYDMPNETIDCKTLLPDEADAILAKGLKIGVVFQHNSDDPATFVADENTAKAHARRVLDLAAANGQPPNSAIYFGIDGADLHLQDLASFYQRRQGRPLSAQEKSDLANRGKRKFVAWYENFLGYRAQAFGPNAKITAESMRPFVKRYLDNVRTVFNEYAQSHSGRTYKIGLYCTGGICDYAASNSLADYYWVTAEGRDLPEYSRFIDEGQWSLLQQLETVCSDWRSKGVSFDFNRVSTRADIGAWSPEPSDRVPMARPLTCPAR
jgi:hypothetical protein